MFSVIISEKGGAERRESFERTEINVGRVQGNDLMLPKGNVSKRHARLLYRDGRFIVTDLKSTNGTYVNGRKIAQATIVREGDKIYIGDFVLRVEIAASAGGASFPSKTAPADGAFVTGSAAGGAAAGAPTTSAPTLGFTTGSAGAGGAGGFMTGSAAAGPATIGTPAAGPVSAMPSIVDSETPEPHFALRPPEKLPSRPPNRVEPKPGDAARNGEDIVSHFPLERDPDESAPYPSPPRVPRPSITKPGVSVPVAPAPPLTSPPPRPQSVIPPGPATATAGVAPVPRRSFTPTEAIERPQVAPFAAHRAALVGLIERVNDAVDLSTILSPTDTEEAVAARIASALSERIASMKIAGELRDTQPEALIAEARREIFELGPIGPMLDDEDVSEIQVVRHDSVVATHGRKVVPSEVAFTSEQAVARVIRRLCIMAGRPLADGEVFVDRRLPNGARITAVLPPASDQGHLLMIRKPQRADLTLEDLVRSGTLSRAMASLLATCVKARVNILVTGAVGSGTTSLIGALAGAGSTDDRVVVLQEEDELVFDQPHTVAIVLGDTKEQGARAAQAAAKMHPDRLVIGAFAGHVAAEVVDAIAQGADGVLAAARAPTLRQAVARLSAGIAAARPGCTPDAAREALASSFDLAIEVARQRDGRHRVLRIAELRPLTTSDDDAHIIVRDIWTFVLDRTAAGGVVEGSFHATGVIPMIVEDLAARGISIDASVFKRQGR